MILTDYRSVGDRNSWTDEGARSMFDALGRVYEPTDRVNGGDVMLPGMCVCGDQGSLVGTCPHGATLCAACGAVTGCPVGLCVDEDDLGRVGGRA